MNDLPRRAGAPSRFPLGRDRELPPRPAGATCHGRPAGDSPRYCVAPLELDARRTATERDVVALAFALAHADRVADRRMILRALREDVEDLARWTDLADFARRRIGR